MNIVLEVFKELNYDAVDEFIVEHSLDEKSIMQVNVKVLIPKHNNSQVFLVVNSSNDKLKNYIEGGLIKEIALQFRKKEYHRAEMDRNTSFLIISEHKVGEEVDISSKVKIEDDPYYFKKYVFTYDEVGLENATSWIKGNDSKDSLITLILGYITDTEKFAKYKENYINEPIYSYFIELVTKIHCFPMKIVETKNINSIEFFLDKEIDKASTRSRKPVNIESTRITDFIKENVDYSNIEDVCNCWNGLIKTESEDKK